MKTIESMLKKEKQELEKMIKRAKERMRTAPQGNIRVRKWRNVVEYYYVEQNKKPTDNGRYMKKNEIGLVRKIVQRDYDERNGIYPGVHLFITHESRNTPLNIKALDALIKSLFCIGE